MRGRLTGLNQVNVGGTMAAVNLANGYAADAFGAPNVLWALGMGFVVVVAASLALSVARGIYRGAVAVPARAG